MPHMWYKYGMARVRISTTGASLGQTFTVSANTSANSLTCASTCPTLSSGDWISLCKQGPGVASNAFSLGAGWGPGGIGNSDSNVTISYAQHYEGQTALSMVVADGASHKVQFGWDSGGANGAGTGCGGWLRSPDACADTCPQSFAAARWRHSRTYEHLSLPDEWLLRYRSVNSRRWAAGSRSTDFGCLVFPIMREVTELDFANVCVSRKAVFTVARKPPTYPWRLPRRIACRSVPGK